jgi:hypothetical protein
MWLSRVDGLRIGGSAVSRSGTADAETPAEVAEPARRLFGRIGYLAMFGSTDQT